MFNTTPNEAVREAATNLILNHLRSHRPADDAHTDHAGYQAALAHVEARIAIEPNGAVRLTGDDISIDDLVRDARNLHGGKLAMQPVRGIMPHPVTVHGERTRVTESSGPYKSMTDIMRACKAGTITEAQAMGLASRFQTGGIR